MDGYYLMLYIEITDVEFENVTEGINLPCGQIQKFQVNSIFILLFYGNG
jgi:hypothetical protein